MLGGGNTAMDCCRTARRLGGEDVKVDRALRLRGDEGVALGEGGRDARGHPDPQLPRAQGIHPRRRQAHRRRVREGRGATTTTRAAAGSCRPASRTCTIECDDVLVAIGQENAFPWIERDIGIEFDRWGMPKVDRDDHAVDPPERLLRRRRGLRPEEHHLGRRARPRGGDLDRPHLPAARRRASARRRMVTLDQPEDGHPRVELRQRHLARPALEGAAARPEDRAHRHQGGGRARLRPASSATPRRSAA